MDIEAMKRFPIEDFLARLGHHPVQRRANAVWYRSPYREEKTPSFKVNPEKNLWFDFGEGKGGNIFALAGEFIKTGEVKEQSEIFEEFDITMSVIDSLLIRSTDSEGKIHISWGSQRVTS